MTKNLQICNGVLYGAIILLLSVCAIFNWMPTLIANLLLVLIFAVFFGLWIAALKNAELIKILWIPAVVLFLMGRPLAALIKGNSWSYHGQEVTLYYLAILFFTVLGLELPAIFSVIKHKFPRALTKKFQFFKGVRQKATASFARLKTLSLQKEKLQNNRIFLSIITTGYFVTLICYLSMKVLDFLNMQGKTYLEFYLAREIPLPWIVTFFGGLHLFFMCIQLSIVKKKGVVISILGAYILSTVPTLLIGQRNPFILAIIFSIIVLYLKNKEIWKIRFSRKAIIIVLCCAVILVLLLVLGMDKVSSSRNEMADESSGIFDRILNFVDSQGFTYETVCYGITHRDYLRQQDNRCYTISPVVDYYTYGQLGNILFGTTSIPGGNNAQRAYLSHDLAHKLSYLVLNENYLKGAGLGTSYVLEVFLNFGLIGVALINCFYSIFLSKLRLLFGKNLLMDTVLLYSLTKVFFIARDNAIIPFYELLTLHFLLVVAGVYLSYYFSIHIMKKAKKSNEEQNIL